MKIRRLFLASLIVAALLLPSRLQAQSGSTPVPVGLPSGSVVGMGPNGATLRCKDGFFAPPGAADSVCQERGGVATRWPVKRTPSRAADARAIAIREADARPRATVALPRPDSTRPPGFEPFALRRQRADSANRAASIKPDGATMLCNDGSWVVRDTASVRCAARGGVKISFAIEP